MEPIGQTSTSQLRIIICVREPAERWLVGTYLQQTHRDITAVETDAMSEAKVAVDQEKVDLILVDIDELGISDYWLGRIVENQLAPVVVLTGSWTEDEAEALFPRGTVHCICKSRLSREHLIDTIDYAMTEWQAIRRGVARQDELEKLSNSDSLTGVYNRRATLQRLEESISRARRYHEELSILLFDVDRFMWLNHLIGRAAADVALERIASLLRRKLRDCDIIGRYGGDEFLVVLPHTGIDSAWVAAERVRTSIEELEIGDAEGRIHPITVSAGLASYEPGDDITAMTHRAEICLCQAKENGRNRVEK